MSFNDSITQKSTLGLPTKLAGALATVGTLNITASGIMQRIHIRIPDPYAIISNIGTGAALGGGVRLLDLPDAFIPMAARITGLTSLSAATATLSSGEIGLGTVVASGLVSALNGTATFENILTGQALAAIGAGESIPRDVGAGPVAQVGTLGASTSIFLNAASAALGVATADLLFKGDISIWGIVPAHLQ